MARGFFVTGTDTGVGKTIAAGALAAALRSRGVDVAAMKPLETGCSRTEGELTPSDGLFLREIAGNAEDLALVSPCRFEHPLAPLAAAELEGASVDLVHVLHAFSVLAARHDAVVVEGVGGLMVPLKRDYFVRELAQEMGLPLIIVSRPGLGALNHILLTVEAALRAGIEIAGILLNYALPPEGDLAERTNPSVLATTCPVRVLGTLPHVTEFSRERLASAAAGSLDMDYLVRLVRRKT